MNVTEEMFEIRSCIESCVCSTVNRELQGIHIGGSSSCRG